MPHAQRPSQSTLMAPSLQRLAARGPHRRARAGGGARTRCTSQTKPRITSLLAPAPRPPAPCLTRPETALSPQHPHSPAARTASTIPMPHAQRPSPSTLKAPSLQRLAARGPHRRTRARGGARTRCTIQTEPRITSLLVAAHRPPAPCLSPRCHVPRKTRTALGRNALTARTRMTAPQGCRSGMPRARPIQQPMPPTKAQLPIETRYAAKVAGAHRRVSAECARGERRRAAAHVYYATLQRAKLQSRTPPSLTHRAPSVNPPRPSCTASPKPPS